MKWEKKEFNGYDRWQFEFTHFGYPIYLVIKFHYFLYRPSYYRAVWRTERMRGSQFEVVAHNPKNIRPTPSREMLKQLFKDLRTSLNYGCNVKSRKVTDRILAANNQRLPHKKSQIAGKA